MDAPIDPFSGSRSATQALAPPTAPDKPAGGSPFDSLLGQIGAGEREAAKKIDALDVERMKLTPPKMELPPKPQPKSTDPIDAWGSIAMVFAALASFKTRSHASTAMNAAAAALKGIQAKDSEAYDHAFKEWEVETKNAIDMAHFQQDTYKTLLESVEHRENLALDEGRMMDAATEAKFRALALALGDPGMIKAYEDGGIAGAVDYQNTRKRQLEEFELKKMALSAAGQKQSQMLLGQQIVASQAFKDEKTELGRLRMLLPVDPEKLQPEIDKLELKEKEDAEKAEKDHASAQEQAKAQYDEWRTTPEGQAATADQRAAKEADLYRQYQAHGRVYPPMTSENKHYTAEQIASYRERMPPLSSIAYRNDPDGWTQVLKEVEDINPGFSDSKYDTVKNARAKITTGKDADAIASYVRLNQHLELFDQLIKRLPDNADVTAFDKMAAWWGRQTGNPDVTSYDAALQLVGDEIVKAATGTGAAGALGDREEIKKNFQPGYSKKQLEQNVDTVRGLVGGAIVSTLNKYRSVLSKEELSNITGLSADDLRRYHVDPEVLQPTVKGPVTLGGRTVNITDQGAEPVAGAPQGQGAQRPQARQTKDGRKAWVMGDKALVEKDGAWVPIDESELQ